jgi:hypothetical protein
MRLPNWVVAGKPPVGELSQHYALSFASFVGFVIIFSLSKR